MKEKANAIGYRLQQREGRWILWCNEHIDGVCVSTLTARRARQKFCMAGFFHQHLNSIPKVLLETLTKKHV